jgi:hypothetical protein
VKQFIILVFAILVIIFSGIWETRYLDQTSKYAISDIQYARNAVLNNDYNLAKEHMKEIENTWSNMKVLWKIFTTHDEINEIEEKLISYKISIEQKNKEDVIIYSEKLYNVFRSIVENHRLLIENVL